MKRSILSMLVIAISMTIVAQEIKTDISNDTTLIKLYKDIITPKANTHTGLFIVHKVEAKYFWELSEDILSRDILVVTRLSKAGADMRNQMFGYAGDVINQVVIRLERGPNNKLFLRKLSNTEYSRDSTMPLYQAVMNNNIQPIAAAFDIKAIHPGTKALVIDVTDYLNGDNDILFFDPGAKIPLRFTMLQPDKSYIVSVNTYPVNTEIKTVKTYIRAAQQNSFGSPGGGVGTVEINSSLVLLPQKPMQARYTDPRVGYFSVGYTDFDLNPQGIKSVSMIKRWRLEAKDEAAYIRGELTEPKKQIVFYIDPATPQKWVPYLIQGVNDWQFAFEKAGFKNAIVAKEAPTKQEDSTWSLEDARFSAIVYKPSSVPNASGPSIADPRSGEILESHINWYHSIMEILQQWYFIQAAPNDPRARKMVLDDELMGQLIRFVSSHEVGHTLGLLHNFGSSSTVPVDSLRNKAWVEKNGHTPSIMDYARFNYVAQPEDNISERGIFPRIGDYDLWAIEWGYRKLPQYQTTEEEKTYLNKWIIEKSVNKRLRFGSESNPSDPRNQSEDIGDDAMKAGMYGIKNLQYILPHLVEWTSTPNSLYGDLYNIYNQLLSQFDRYIGHVMKNVGGRYTTPKSLEQGGAIFETVPKGMQKRAVMFLKEQVLITPMWVINKNIQERIGGEPVEIISRLQNPVIGKLLSLTTINNLINAEARDGSGSYKAIELLTDVKNAVWSELANKQAITIYRRNLQKKYIDNLIELAGLNKNIAERPPVPGSPGLAPFGTRASNNSDAASLGKMQLKQLRSEIKIALPFTRNAMTKYHLQDCLERIEETLAGPGTPR